MLTTLKLSVSADLDTRTANGRGFLALNGGTVALMAASIVADLAAVTDTPTHILFNLGANDSLALPAQAVWEANLATILDAMHTKWPSIRIYVSRPWRRGAPAGSLDSIATWINNVRATRTAWVFLGDDERVWLEGGDDGATNTSDGLHYSVAGAAAKAAQMVTVLGY